MNEASITQYIADTFSGVDIVHPESSGGPAIAAGDTFFIYDPDRNLEANRTFPFATIVTKNYGEFDCASNLNRAGVFRLNIGVGKLTCEALFPPGREYDFTALDQLLPHPVYGRMHWICVLNPGDGTFHNIIRPLLAEAYETAVRRHGREEKPK